MLQKIRYYFMGILLVFLACCNEITRQQEYSSLRLQVIGPFGCFEEIIVNKNGHSQIRSGPRNADITSESVGVDSVLFTRSFQIQSAERQQKLDKLVKDIAKSEKKSSSFKYDAYRFRLYVDGVIKVDIFGENLDIYNLVKLLIQDIPSPNPCEYFVNFKRRKS